MRLFDRVVETKKLNEQNMSDVIWPLLEFPFSVENFQYQENGYSFCERYVGRGVVLKILKDEFLNPAVDSDKTAVRGIVNFYKSGKRNFQISLYRLLGYEFLIPLGKSLSFTHFPSDIFYKPSFGKVSL